MRINQFILGLIAVAAVVSAVTIYRQYRLPSTYNAPALVSAAPAHAADRGPLLGLLMRLASSVRAVAVFEAAKGALVLLAGFGALSLLGHDAQRLAEQLVTHLHLNPASRYPRIFIDAAAHVSNAQLWILATFAATYAVVRSVEAYGLWRGKRWAAWFAAISGGIYIPFECYELFKGETLASLGALVVNVLIVGIMIKALLLEGSAEAIRLIK